MTYYCKKCGSDNVQLAMWVEVNHNFIVDDFGSWNEFDTTYCSDCAQEGDEVHNGLTEHEDEVRHLPRFPTS